MRYFNKILKKCPETGRVIGLKNPKGFYTVLFFVLGILSILWFLIRVIPKPSRATYPCMKATMPIAYSFVSYLVSLTGSVLFFKKAVSSIKSKRYLIGISILAISLSFATMALIKNQQSATANTQNTSVFADPLGPNAPIGEAKGIFPGRVVWIYNPNATNEKCTNMSKDAYYLDFNTNQDTVSKMFGDALLDLTGQETYPEAWDTIFKYFNSNHGKGSVGYKSNETIFIKINCVTAWGGAPSDGSTTSTIEYDTSPQAIMALLRQLVNEAKVTPANIYIGDPIADVFNNVYDKIHAEFPDIKVVTSGTTKNRYKLTPNTATNIFYSDKGSVLKDLPTPITCLYKEMSNADYLLNIPTMKGHRWAGVTFFAKNHFGSNTSDNSWYLHAGLVNNDDKGMRSDYKMYRVLVDFMASKYLGRKTLLYFMEGLWATSYEHQKPQKFMSSPFNNDWCSSIFLSQDGVAIESVCLDVLQREFTKEDLTVSPKRYTYVRYGAVDDHLHQAASSDWWPEGISYDPDKAGTPIKSLGVHEHWNDTTNMQYSRNLGTGQGIELIKEFHSKVSQPVGIANNSIKKNDFTVYPNPCTQNSKIMFSLISSSKVHLSVVDLQGRIVTTIENRSLSAGSYSYSLPKIRNASGLYYCVLQTNTGNKSIQILVK
jgi:hypothetical protein